MKRFISVMLLAVMLLAASVGCALAESGVNVDPISYIEDITVEPMADRTVTVNVTRQFVDLYNSLFRQQYIYVTFTGTTGPRTVEVRLLWYNEAEGNVLQFFDQKEVELNGRISWYLPRASEFELDVVTGEFDLREGKCTFVVTGHI